MSRTRVVRAEAERRGEERVEMSGWSRAEVGCQDRCGKDRRGPDCRVGMGWAGLESGSGREVRGGPGWFA